MPVDRKQISSEIRRAQKFLKKKEGVRPVEIKGKLTSLMWDKVGIFRTGREIQEAIVEIERVKEKGLPGSRFRAYGFGGMKPAGSNETEEGRYKNRRTEFKLTKKHL